MTTLRKRTVSFSGHRQIKKGDIELIRNNLENLCEQLIKERFQYFLVGGAVGFDYEAFRVVERLREKYPIIQLILIIPSEDYFEKYWDIKDKIIYDNMLSSSNKVIYITEKHTDSCIRERNLRLVNESTVLIYYMHNEMSGTGQTIRFAERANLQLLNIMKKYFVFYGREITSDRN